MLSTNMSDSRTAEVGLRRHPRKFLRLYYDMLADPAELMRRYRRPLMPANVPAHSDAFVLVRSHEVGPHSVIPQRYYNINLSG